MEFVGRVQQTNGSWKTKWKLPVVCRKQMAAAGARYRTGSYKVSNPGITGLYGGVSMVARDGWALGNI